MPPAGLTPAQEAVYFAPTHSPEKEPDAPKRTQRRHTTRTRKGVTIVDWPLIFTYAVVGTGAAAVVMRITWAVVWWRREQHGIAILDMLLALWWTVVVALYLANVTAAFDFATWGQYTLRPMLAILALIGITQALVHYRYRAPPRTTPNPEDVTILETTHE